MADIGFNRDEILKPIEKQTAEVKKLMEEVANAKDISAVKMFSVQMAMNLLQQVMEMSTSVISGIHQGIQSMARNVKG